MAGRFPLDRHPDVFDAAPVALLLLDRDLVMLAANQAYRRSVGWSDADADASLGRSVLEVFPNAPGRVSVDGVDQVTSLRELMVRAVETADPQVVTGFRYDIPVPGTDRFVERHWNVTEVPLLDDRGEVEFLLHFNEDVTDLVERLEAGEAAAVEREQLQQRVSRAQVDLLQRAQQLQELNLRLQAAGAHDRAVATALQRAMLTDLPEPGPLHLVARYRTAAGDQVGGDWYDALPLPDDATALVIGDVLGHDIAAAGVMGQLRSMLRALVWHEHGPPAHVLRLLDHAMRDLRVDTMLTAVLATVEPDDDGSGRRLLRWSNAGHPPPVLLQPDGRTDVLAGEPTDALLGVATGRDRHDHTRHLAPGSTLVLYTDGLVETREQDLDHGIDRLRRAMQRHRDLPPEAFVDAVLDELVDEHPADDVAVLVVRVRPDGAPV